MKGQKKIIRTVCCVAAPGTTTPRIAGVRIVTTTTPITITTTTDFVYPALLKAGVPCSKEFGREQKSPLLFLSFNIGRRRKREQVLSRIIFRKIPFLDFKRWVFSSLCQELIDYERWTPPRRWSPSISLKVESI